MGAEPLKNTNGQEKDDMIMAEFDKGCSVEDGEQKTKSRSRKTTEEVVVLAR